MKKKSFIVIVILLIAIILGLCVFIAYDKNLFGIKGEKKESSNTVEKKDDASKTKDVSNDFDLEQAEQLLTKFGFNEEIGCFSSKIYDSYYSDDYKQIVVLNNAFNNNELKTHKKCSEVYSSDKYSEERKAYEGDYGVCYEEHGTSIIAYEDANKIYNELYGIDMPKKGVNSGSLSGMYYKFYDYIESLDSFAIIECGGCGGACGTNGNEFFDINKLRTAYTKDNSLIIEVYHDILEFKPAVDRDGEYKYVSTTKNRNIKLSSKNVDDAKQEIEEKYLDKLDIYEVEFSKKDGNYIFKSLTKKLS